MITRTLLVAATAGACLLAAPAAPAQENCQPQIEVNESNSCGNSAPFKRTLGNGTAQDLWCKTTETGKVQSNVRYRTTTTGGWIYSYTTLFNCSDCEWEIRRATEENGSSSFYNRYCGGGS